MPQDQSQKPSSVDVTKLIDLRMAQNHVNVQMPLMELFALGAVEVAITQCQTEGRGIILGLMTPQKKFLYVPQANISTALWMVNIQMKREVATFLEQYDQLQEAVIVMVVPPTVQLFSAKRGGTMQMLAIATVELTPITLPPEGVWSKVVGIGRSLWSRIHFLIIIIIQGMN